MIVLLAPAAQPTSHTPALVECRRMDALFSSPATNREPSLGTLLALVCTKSGRQLTSSRIFQFRIWPLGCVEGSLHPIMTLMELEQRPHFLPARHILHEGDFLCFEGDLPGSGSVPTPVVGHSSDVVRYPGTLVATFTHDQLFAHIQSPLLGSDRLPLRPSAAAGGAESSVAQRTLPRVMAPRDDPDDPERAMALDPLALGNELDTSWGSTEWWSNGPTTPKPGETPARAPDVEHLAVEMVNLDVVQQEHVARSDTEVTRLAESQGFDAGDDAITDYYLEGAESLRKHILAWLQRLDRQRWFGARCSRMEALMGELARGDALPRLWDRHNRQIMVEVLRKGSMLPIEMVETHGALYLSTPTRPCSYPRRCMHCAHSKS